MSLRIRILLFLTLFALLPLGMAVVINLPLVLDRVDGFYRHAFLQNLRADFADLDQHLAARDSSLRLLAKLPEPGILLGTLDNQPDKVEAARLQYSQWINLILGEQRDITQIVFTDDQGVSRFWLERDAETSALVPTLQTPVDISQKELQRIVKGEVTNVISTPLMINKESQDPRRFMSLQLLSPIEGSSDGKKSGVVAITLDVAGLVRRDPTTLWANNDGHYLRLPGTPAFERTAFEDFPGLAEIFAGNKVNLWEGDDKRAIWVPMFLLSTGEPLWVGRQVDDKPLEIFRSEMIVRVLVIIAGLVVLVLVSASTIAKRTERIGSELIGGIQDTLETDTAVEFHWDDSPELQQLADDLTRLSSTHAEQVKAQRAHTRELEESNRYKSEFLANVSHELRTPLNSIVLLSKLLSNDAELQGEAKQKASVIHKASGDLKALIDNILDMSRVEAGQMVVHFEAVKVAEIVSDLQMLLSPQFEEKNLSLSVEVDELAPIAFISDPDKVRQVLKNFLGNALKFTEQGGVILSVKPAKPPFALEFAVIDPGIGIPPEKQKVIFEAFKQADGSTSRRFGGTGLGLTISRQLATLLGGDITLQSETGKGATFTLLLPPDCEDCAEETVVSVETQSRPQEAVVEPPAIELDCAGCHMLVLDTDIRRQLQLSELCKRWGADISLAGDLEEALETMEEISRVDVVMLNLQLPDLEPCATIKELKQHAASEALFIGLTSSPKEDGEDCLQEGLDHVIEQPLNVDDLVKILDMQFTKKSLT